MYTKNNIETIHSLCKRSQEPTRLFAIFCLLIIELFYLTTATNAATYYVDINNGNDTAAGTSVQTAWKTFPRAWPHYSGEESPVITEGDIILLAEGDYGDFDGALNQWYEGGGDTGRSTWITYRGTEGNEPTLHYLVMKDVQSAYIKFYNIKFTYPDSESNGDKCLHLWGANYPNTYIEFHNCIFDGSNSDLSNINIMVANYQNILFDNCEIYSGAWGMKVVSLGTSLTIRDCHFHDQWQEIMYVDADYGEQIIDLLIENTRFEDLTYRDGYTNGTGAIHGDYFQYGGTGSYDGITFRRCQFKFNFDIETDLLWYGEMIIGPQAQSYNFIFENNLMYGPGNGNAFRIEGNSATSFKGTDGIIVRNNTFAYDMVGNTNNTNKIEELCTNVKHYNNIWLTAYHTKCEGASQDNNIYTEYRDSGSGTDAGENSVELTEEQVKSLFTDWTNNDYTLDAAVTPTAVNFGDEAHAPATDIIGISRDSSPDAGCYEYIPSDPNIQTYSITASAGTGGQINPSGTTLVVSGGSQIYTITANAGYDIYDVVVDGNSVGAVSSYNFTNVTSNRTISASFTIKTYTITASAGDNGQISPEGITQINYGGSQAYTIEADPGYEIADVLVDGGSVGAVSSYDFTDVTSNRTISVSFAIKTYTITASAGDHGQINPDGITQVNHGGSQAYTITADSGYKISDVLVNGSSVGAVSSHEFTDVSTNHTITASFVIDEEDNTDPEVANLSPLADSIQVPLNTLLTLDITDAGDGVDADTVTIEVDNNTIYTGDTAKYSSASGDCYRIGTKANYRFIYQSGQHFDFDQTINVTVNATDLAGNEMNEYSYSFKTEMRSFSDNIKVNSNTLSSNAMPATVRDSGGNIWVAWHTGTTGNKDIYIGKLTAGTEAFVNIINLTNNATDQRNPVIALGTDDKLYVAWQDNRNGNWDIYVSTSSDGINWSAETKVTDSNDTQINPAIAVDSSSPNKVYIAWEDSRNGNQDIYVGVSNNGFVSTTISQITSDLAYQGEPAIAVDSANTVYAVWTDKRFTGKNDIYGAASDESWANVAIVTADNSQSSPAIATEADGTILHLVWVDDRGGDDDIYYAPTSNGLPTSPLTGSSIIDDTSGADQKQPVIAVTGITDSNLHVFICWQDERGVSSTGDTDLFFMETSSGSGTNIFVGDEETNTEQSEPAIGIDNDGHPYLVWTNDNTDIYYAGSTFMEPDAVASGNVSMSSGATVGTFPPTEVDHVSVVLPEGAYPCDIMVAISKINNPQAFHLPCLGAYDFGPSNIEFTEPVTVTIPYNFTGIEDIALAYWYNSLTDELSQQGITNVQTIAISSTVHALRFNTTHFTPFYIFLGTATASTAASGGGGGGGGCSMSPHSQASVVELLLPYIGLAATMVVIKLRDRRKRKTCN